MRSEMVGEKLLLWEPAIAIPRHEFQSQVIARLWAAGYREVYTPHISHHPRPGPCRVSIPCKISTVTAEEQEDRVWSDREAQAAAYALRSDCCYAHGRIFAAIPHSFRDLPLRLYEVGEYYYLEDGQIRVTSRFLLHSFCEPEQVQNEFSHLKGLGKAGHVPIHSWSEAPESWGLNFVASNGSKQPPMVLHADLVGPIENLFV